MKSRRPTPLEPSVCGFRDHLITQGYSENRLALHMRHMAHLGRWLDEHGVDLGNFNLTHVEAFLVDRRAAYPYLSRLSLRGLAPLLGYLRRIDVLPQPPPSVPATPAEFLLNHFMDYLRRERGLADETIAHYHYTASRSIETIKERIAAYVEAGVQELALGFEDPTSVDQVRQFAELFIATPSSRSFTPNGTPTAPTASGRSHSAGWTTDS